VLVEMATDLWSYSSLVMFFRTSMHEQRGFVNSGLSDHIQEHAAVSGHEAGTVRLLTYLSTAKPDEVMSKDGTTAMYPSERTL